MLDTSSLQAVSSTSSNTTTVAPGPNRTLGQDQFMNLLIAQLLRALPHRLRDASDSVSRPVLLRAELRNGTVLHFVHESGAARRVVTSFHQSTSFMSHEPFYRVVDVRSRGRAVLS